MFVQPLSLLDAIAKAIEAIGDKPTLIVSVGAVYEVPAEKMANTLRAQGAKVTLMHLKTLNNVAEEVKNNGDMPDFFQNLVFMGQGNLTAVIEAVKIYHRGGEDKIFHIN